MVPNGRSLSRRGREVHCVYIRWVAGLTLSQLLELLVRKCQEYRSAPETFKFSLGTSSFPQMEMGGG